MKAIFSILLVTGVVFSSTAKPGPIKPAAKTTKYSAGYSQNSCNCIATQQGDKVIVFSQGREMTEGVTLSPGIKITSGGLLKKEGGAERLLVDGNCVSERGTITMQVK